VREARYTTKFERDLKREGKSPNNKDLDFKLQRVINLLLDDQVLPSKYRDHALSGKYSDTRECHVKPDLLLVYFKRGDNLLFLVRLGSHADIFG
jgi:mRNA interferase YafQ